MRIGIDVREFEKDVYTGLRTILHDFLEHVHKFGEHEFVFFGNQDTDFESIPGKGKKVLLYQKNVILWDQLQLPGRLRREKVDVYFTPYIKTPILRVCPYVNTIADIIPLVAPKFKGIKAIAEKVYFSVYSFLCGRRAVKIITLSEDARAKISRTFGIDQDRFKVVYPAVEKPTDTKIDTEKDLNFTEKYDLRRPYFLYVGNFKPHKNVARLVEAFAFLPDDIKKEYRLILVGGSAEQIKTIEPVVEKHGFVEQVIFVENLEHDDMNVFFNNASIFVFPSLAEGFGIPPVEAMVRGLPVAASKLDPMLEVLGETAIFFDPKNPEDMARVMSRLVNEKSLREQCTRHGDERRKMFGAEKMSQKILDVLENAGSEKTLCISSEFPPVIGGISTQLFNLWSRLPEKEIVILTAAPKGQDLGPNEGLDVVSESYPLGADILSRSLRTIAVIWHTWKQNRIRKVRRNHCAQVLSTGLAGLLVKMLRGTPYVVYVYSADILEFSKNFFTRWIIKNVIKEADYVIANSNFTKGICVDRNLAPTGKIVVLTPGVDMNIFSIENKDESIREKYGISETSKVILTVARLDRRKGHKFVIEALPEIIKEQPDLTYVIVGHGEMFNDLERLAKEKGLKDNIVFTGEVSFDRLPHLYNTCDVAVMVPEYLKKTGNVEGFGIVFLEANACGKPVVAGNSGGVSEAVIDGQTGILVEPNDVAGIRDAILRLLEDKVFAEKLGKQGFDRVHDDFDWTSRAEELKKYI